MKPTSERRRVWVRITHAKALDQFMTFRGETNRSLARKADISPGIVSHLRSGARNSCLPTTARAIAKALDVPVESLFLPEVSTYQAASSHKAGGTSTASSTAAKAVA